MSAVLDPRIHAAVVPSLADVRRRHTRIRDVNAEHSRNRSRLDRVAARVADRIGTTGFVLAVLGWCAVALVWVIVSVQLRADATTPFGIWLFGSVLLQTVLLPLVLFGQTTLARHFQLRAKADFEAAKKAEAEIDLVVEHLLRQTEVLSEIAHELRRQSGSADAPRRAL